MFCYFSSELKINQLIDPSVLVNLQIVEVLGQKYWQNICILTTISFPRTRSKALLVFI